jgi:hypothetical protein
MYSAVEEVEGILAEGEERDEEGESEVDEELELEVASV